jgi:hypothetical protein
MMSYGILYHYSPFSELKLRRFSAHNVPHYNIGLTSFLKTTLEVRFTDRCDYLRHRMRKIYRKHYK